MDAAKIAELAPDVAAAGFSVDAVNNKIDTLPVAPVSAPVVAPTPEQVLTLWNLFTSSHRAMSAHGGIVAMSRTVGIKPEQGASLIRQFDRLIAERRAETAEPVE